MNTVIKWPLNSTKLKGYRIYFIIEKDNINLIHLNVWQIHVTYLIETLKPAGFV